MAGSQFNSGHSSQQRIPFEGAEQDARVEFRQKMTALRDKLKRVTPEAVGLTGLRWEQVRELIMAIMSYTLAGRQPELAGMLRTSGLSRDQWYLARENALALGLVTASRRYVSRRRRVDQLAVDQLAVDQLARGPTKSDQVQLGPTRSDQVRPSPTSIKEDTTRAAKELPNNLSSAAANTNTKAAAGASDFSIDQWKLAIPTANRLLKAIAPLGRRSLTPAQQEWVMKVALLAVKFGPAWIEPAFERLRHAPSRSPQGLVAIILDDECQRLGTRFNREMALITIPEEIFNV